MSVEGAVTTDQNVSAAAIGRTADTTLARRVTVDSIWILSGYAVTSGAGFLFWVLAARLIPPRELGVETAVYSLITAAAAIAASGVGNALLVMLPRPEWSPRALLRLGVCTAVGIAVVTGLTAGILATTVLDTGQPPWLTVLAVGLAVVAWALFVVKDPVLTAVGQARLTLLVNGPVNLIKLALLPAFVFAGFSVANPFLFAAVAPALVAVLLVYGLLIPKLFSRFGDRAGSAADPAVPTPAVAPDASANRRSFFAFVLRDGTANGLYLGVLLVLPFLVTALAGAEQGALFALCFQISLVLDLVGIGVGAALATHTATSHAGPPGTGTDAGSGVAVKIWLRVLAVVSLGAVALVAVAPLLLGALGDFYRAGSGVAIIALLGAGSVLRTSFEIWGATLRARQKTSVVLLCNTVFAALLLPLVIVLAGAFGAVGAAAALLLVTVGLSVAGLVGLLGGRNRKARA